MKLDNYRWRFPEPVPIEVQSRLDAFSLPFQSILFQRELNTTEKALQFLLPNQPSWSAQTELRHLDKACQVIEKAIRSDLPIGVFGDYDADGITATALLTLALREIHSSVIPSIPSRLEDGYGLNKNALDDYARLGVKLVITVDNGIRAFEEALYAEELGIDLIITDHHKPGSVLPKAVAVVDPKLPDDPYPNKHLAGVGVAYKLICSLAKHFQSLHPEDYLDLVAIGTIGDVVPLLGENRYLVKQGLKRLNTRPRQSLHSLIGAAGLSGNTISSSDISFQIAPRLNASGRLENEDNLIPLQLLLAMDTAECGSYAQILENHNHQRRSLSKDLQDFVDRKFNNLDSLPPILIALDDQVNLGVAGIAAGHLSRKYYLPAIVGRTDTTTTTASCRSIPEFDMISALENISDLFDQFGGHKLAAGFTLANENLSVFQDAITDLAGSQLNPADLHPVLDIDAVVTFADLDRGLFKEISKLEPTGEKNPQPIFVSKGLKVQKSSVVGSEKDHLKLTLKEGSYQFNAIGFGFGELLPDLPEKLDIAFHFTENNFRGRKEYQLQIIDLSAA
jgi:single-stranded-DNA-specific exonuclease